MSSEGEPLAVAVAGLNAGLVARLEALLSTQRVVARAVPLADIAEGHASHSAVILVGVGTTSVEDDPRLVRLLRSDAGVPVVLFSELDNDTALLAALGRGAAGYLLAGISAEELVPALQRASAGQTVVDLAMGGRIAGHVAHGRWREQRDLDDWGLRPRERDVLEGLLEGQSNREIARELSLGEETVKTYLRNLYRKLGARDRSQAMAITSRRR